MPRYLLAVGSGDGDTQAIPTIVDAPSRDAAAELLLDSGYDDVLVVGEASAIVRLALKMLDVDTKPDYISGEE